MPNNHKPVMYPTRERIALVVVALVLIVFIGLSLNKIGPDTKPQITPAPVEVQSLPVGFILRPIPPHVYQYLIDNYAAYNKATIALIASWDDWCYGVTCQHWILKPYLTHPPIMIRCYPDFDNVCVPTVEQYNVVPAPGQQPTPTLYPEPTQFAPGQGVGAPAS